MGPHVTDWIQAAAAALTMLAAFAALIIAIKAPRWAAKFAEEYRSQNAVIERVELLRLTVLTALLKNRSELLHPDARAAINLVDLAFPRDSGVRNARDLFIRASIESDATNIVERYHALIEAVVRAMNFSQHLTGFDVRAGYYPEAIQRLDAAAIADAEEKIARRAAIDTPTGEQKA